MRHKVRRQVVGHHGKVDLSFLDRTDDIANPRMEILDCIDHEPVLGRDLGVIRRSCVAALVVGYNVARIVPAVVSGRCKTSTAYSIRNRLTCHIQTRLAHQSTR